MKALIFNQPGDADELYISDVADPTYAADEMLVRVHATALNRADTLQRRGFYPPPPGASEILGLEMAGEVVAVGDQVSKWQVGDRVCALLPGGGYAELVALPAAMALPIPDHLSYVEAAALPEVWFTAFDNIFNWGRLQAGEWLLVHGGGSGVGTAAIQLATYRKAKVIITAGSTAKIERCVALGAAAGVNYHDQDWPEQVLKHSDGQGVDVVLDIVGGPYLEPNMRCLATEGRLVIIGTMGGAEAELDIRTLMRKRLTVAGTTLRARPLEAKIALTEQIRQEIWPGFEQQQLQPVIDRVFSWEQAAEAHELMESSEHFGKIVLEIIQAE